MASVQIVDDSDPAVVYSSGWQKAGGGNEYSSTTSWTNRPRMTATLIFEGIQISVMGSVGPSGSGSVPPQSNYSIDGATPTTYTATQDQGVHYNTKFYQSPVLPNGRHTLVITNLLASDSLYLDFFLIYKSATEPSPSVSPLVSMVTVTRPTTVLFTPTPTPIASSDTGIPTSVDKPSTSRSNTAAIAGSFFGAAVFIVLAFAGVIYLRGRNRRNKQEIDDMASPKVEDESDNREPKLPFHTPFSPTSGDIVPPYGPNWGAQQAYNGNYNVDTALQHYPPNGMPQQAPNETYNGNTAQPHYVVNPPNMMAQHVNNGAYDPYASQPY